jgi:hypothetical protein
MTDTPRIRVATLHIRSSILAARTFHLGSHAMVSDPDPKVAHVVSSTYEVTL